MAHHQLPAYIHARNLRAALGFSAEILDDEDKTIVCDAGKLTFVDPSGLCILAAICHRLASSGKNLELENMPDSIAGYLARMDLFKACGIEYDEKFTRHDRASDLVELSMLDRRAVIDECAARIANALVGSMPGFDPDAAPDEMTGYRPYDHIKIPLSYLFTEMLENSLTHGKRKRPLDTSAWVAAQYYRSNDRIRLAVLDNGCGFLGSLQGHRDLQEHSHLAAIRLALLPRVTCNPDLAIRRQDTANQSIGLTVIREITRQSQGTMRLASGDHVLDLTGGGRERASRVVPWQGVIFALEFERDLLRQINVYQVIQALRDLPSPRGLRFE